MTETPVPSQDEGAPAATATATSPAPTTEEIQTLIATEAQKIVDARIPGLQSAYEKQIASLKKDLNDVRRAGLSETELVDETQSNLEAELKQARKEADGLRAGRAYPEVYPVFERMAAAATVEEQLDVLQGFVKDAGTPPVDAAPAQSAEAPAGEPTPPTDLNRPRPDPTPLGVDPSNMDANLAQRIIDSVGDVWPKS